MNLLAHLWLAEVSQTSAAGQLLGDRVKGRLDGSRFSAATEQGIHLHRRIDAVSDEHPAHGALRRQFQPPLRRYAGILVDIGLDHALATAWAHYSQQPLTEFACQIAERITAEWPANAPTAAPDARDFARLLISYTEQRGIRQALASVSRRASRATPLARAAPVLIARRAWFQARLPAIMTSLETEVRRQCRSSTQTH